jgi:hypothetical protein
MKELINIANALSTEDMVYLINLFSDRISIVKNTGSTGNKEVRYTAEELDKAVACCLNGPGIQLNITGMFDDVAPGITVKIICRKHGMFEQKPDDHLQGQGCPECAEHEFS